MEAWVVRTILTARLSRYKRYSKGYGCRALQRAIRLGTSSIIDLLLEEGIDSNAIVNEKPGGGAMGWDHTTGIGIEIGISALGFAIRWDKTHD